MTGSSARVWFREPLETVATFWRVLRRDGVTLGFVTHDRDIWIDGVLHRAAPGVLPSAIRKTAGFEPDSAEVQGALSHASLSSRDLAAGRFDGAQVAIGLVDWTSGEASVLFRGAIGTVDEDDGRFAAQLQSAKTELQRDIVPRTSPSCRAVFCGPGCTLSAARFTHETRVATVDGDAAAVTLAAVPPGDLLGGSLRWFDGPHAGIEMQIAAQFADVMMLDRPVEPGAAGARVRLREGCDRTLQTCADRFANAINFQGEPFLPGNDLIARYAAPAA